MRCCDCEFRKECRDEDTVLTAFVRCNIREQKIKQREAEQALRTPQNGEARGMKERTKSEWEEIINEFGENVKSIIKDHYFEGKIAFDIEQEYKINKKCLHNLEIMFYDFYARQDEK